jgi:hypothetical protein
MRNAISSAAAIALLAVLTGVQSGCAFVPSEPVSHRADWHNQEPLGVDVSATMYDCDDAPEGVSPSNASIQVDDSEQGVYAVDFWDAHSPAQKINEGSVRAWVIRSELLIQYDVVDESSLAPSIAGDFACVEFTHVQLEVTGMAQPVDTVSIRRRSPSTSEIGRIGRGPVGWQTSGGR